MNRCSSYFPDSLIHRLSFWINCSLGSTMSYQLQGHQMLTINSSSTPVFYKGLTTTYPELMRINWIIFRKHWTSSGTVGHYHFRISSIGMEVQARWQSCSADFRPVPEHFHLWFYAEHILSHIGQMRRLSAESIAKIVSLPSLVGRGKQCLFVWEP